MHQRTTDGLFLRARVALAIALVLLPAAAMSQECLGLTSLDRVKVNLLGEYRSAEGASAAGAGIAFRVGQRSFVSVDYARSMADDTNVGSHRFGAGFGLEVRAARPDGWRLCPLVTLLHERADELDLEGLLGITFGARATTVLAGVGVGRMRGDPAVLAFAPFAVAQLAYARATIELGGFKATDAQEFAQLQFGAGVHFSDVVAVRPSVVIPIGLGEPTPVLVLTVGLGVGRLLPGARGRQARGHERGEAQGQPES